MTAVVEDALRDAHGVPRDWPFARNSLGVVADGVRWHVQVQGRGPTIVFLHGAGASAHSFAPLISALHDQYTCVAFDLPGHGFTSPFRGGAYTLRRTARAFEALLATLDAKPALVVGHSAGAAIALQWQLDRAAARLASATPIVALNPALRPFGGLAGVTFPFMARLAAASGTLADFVARRATDRRQVERLIAGTGSQVPNTMLDCYQYLMQQPAHVQAVLSMMAGWQLDALVHAVRALDPDLHVVLGERDRAVPPGRTASILSGLQKTRVTKFAACGHLVHEEAPDQVAGLLHAALARTGDALHG